MTTRKITAEQLQRFIKKIIKEQMEEAHWSAMFDKGKQPSKQKGKIDIEKIKKFSMLLNKLYAKNPELFSLFGPPEYGGITSKLSSKFGTDLVDVIQEYFDDVEAEDEKLSVDGLAQRLIQYIKKGYDMAPLHSSPNREDYEKMSAKYWK